LTVSIVIAGVSGEPAVNRCVQSIRKISGDRDFELIVLWGEPQDVFRLRAEGIAQASGERTAVVGDRYEVIPSWPAALLEKSTFEVLCGPVAPADGLSYWGWCVYLSEYAHLAPPVKEGTAVDAKLLPDGNVVYDATVVRRFPPLTGEAGLTYHRRLLQAGISAAIRSDLEVHFAVAPEFREYIRERFWLSREIGREGGAIKLFVAPFLPFLVLVRVGRNVLEKPLCLARFLLCAPVIFLLGAVQSAGEFAGAIASKTGR
jgi:hypothetical protein